jgi:hypothetical protein
MRIMSIIARLRMLDVKTDVLPFVVATAGEFTALFFWLQYLDQGRFWLANGILWAGFLVERISVIVWIRFVYRARGQTPAKVPGLLPTVFGLLAITLSEIAIWILWRAMADGQIAWLNVGATANVVLAAVVLMGLMLAEHSVEMAALKNTKPWAYLGNRSTIFFTFMEVIGAVAWLAFVRNGQPVLGGICLLVGLSIEHVLQGSDLRPEPAAEPAAGDARLEPSTLR